MLTVPPGIRDRFLRLLPPDLDKLGLQFPPVLYRFDEKREYGEDILRGNVFVSTLERCRRTEDVTRRDELDGKIFYRTGVVNFDSHDPRDRKIRSRMEELGMIGIEDGGRMKNVSFADNNLEQYIPDAFLYWTTVQHDPEAMKDFGECCIRIKRPREFFYQMTVALVRDAATSFDDPTEPIEFHFLYAHEVRYTDPHYRDVDDEPGVVGFVKRPDKYEKEQEFRMLWYPQKWPRSIEGT